MLAPNQLLGFAAGLETYAKRVTATLNLAFKVEINRQSEYVILSLGDHTVHVCFDYIEKLRDSPEPYYRVMVINAIIEALPRV